MFTLDGDLTRLVLVGRGDFMGVWTLSIPITPLCLHGIGEVGVSLDETGECPTD